MIGRLQETTGRVCADGQVTLAAPEAVRRIETPSRAAYTASDLVVDLTLQTVQARTIHDAAHGLHERIFALFLCSHLDSTGILLQRLAFTDCFQKNTTELIDRQAIFDRLVRKIAAIVLYCERCDLADSLLKLALCCLGCFRADFVVIYFGHLDLLFHHGLNSSTAVHTDRSVGRNGYNACLIRNPRGDRNRPVPVVLWFHFAYLVTDADIASDTIFDVVINLSSQRTLSKAHHRP